MAFTEFSFNWNGGKPKQEEPPKNILTTVQDWLERYGVSEDREHSYQYRGYPVRQAQPQQPAQRYVPSYGQTWQNWMNGRQYTPYATRGYGGVRTDPYLSGQRTPAQPYGYPTLHAYQQQRQAAAQRAANAYAQRYQQQYQAYRAPQMTAYDQAEKERFLNLYTTQSPALSRSEQAYADRLSGQAADWFAYMNSAQPPATDTGMGGSGYGGYYPYPFFYGGGGGYTYSTPKKTRYYNDLMMWNINKPGA